VARRFELSEELIAGDAHAVHRVDTVGRGPVERVLSLVLLGDLVSLYLAVLRGIDPVHVTAIDTLKERLRAARA
jgi:glucose/mannose-6-phosphate isomerase